MSVATTDLGRISATDLAAAIRPRQTSRQEVIESHLRIEAVNPSINALTVVLGEQALEAAKSANRAAVAGSGDLPPLHGAPFTVRENINLVGTPPWQSHGNRGGSPPIGPGDRHALPRGPLPRCRGSVQPRRLTHDDDPSTARSNPRRL